MPSRKRALDEADANVQPMSKRNASAKSNGKAGETVGQHVDLTQEPVEKDQDQQAENAPDECQKKLSERDPKDYICIYRPVFDFEDEQDARAGEEYAEDDDEYSACYKKYLAAAKGASSVWAKLAADHPEWKWVMMVDCVKKLQDLRTRQIYINPNNFGVNVYQDWFGYGLMTLIQETIDEFHREYMKKAPERSLHHMWALVAALGHWMTGGIIGRLTMVDDADGIAALMRIVGTAVLTTLDDIEHAGRLTPASEFRDLGLVMSLHLRWSEGLEDVGLNEEGEMSWRPMLLAYANKAGIDLVADGCYLMSGELQKEEFKKVRALKKAKLGRWKWNKEYKDYKDVHGDIPPLHGDLPSFDITTWPRELRANWNFDGVDVLKHLSDEDIREGPLAFQRI